MTTPLTDHLNQALKFAVETNSMETLYWVFTQGTPTNINECILLAVEKNRPLHAEFLAKKMSVPAPAVIVKKTPRALTLIHGSLSMDLNRVAHKNSVLMHNILYTSPLALQALEEGSISLEEINYQNSIGWTVLMYLCRYGRHISSALTIIHKLIALGADVNLQDDLGKTALMLACQHSGKTSANEIVEILLKHPAIDPNLRDCGGHSALVLASCFANDTSSEKTVELLLAHPKIDVNLPNDLKQTASIVCCKNYGNPHTTKKTVAMLIQHPKNDFNLRDFNGKTAIEYLIAHL